MTSADRTIIGGSFLLSSLAGSWFIANHWSAQAMKSIAFQRAALFVVVMAIVHFLGYCVYARQSAQPASNSRGRLLPSRQPTQLAEGCKLAVLQQVFVLLISALMLDGGQLLRISVIVVLAHWTAIGLITFR